MPLDSTTSITLFGITVWDEGAKEQYARTTTSSATRTLVCAWADRAALINALRGAVLQQTPNVVQYTPPAAYPDAPWLFVDTVDVEGIPGETGLSVAPTGLVAYKYARIRIIYRSLPYQEGSETGVLSVDYGSEWFTLSNATPSLKFTDGAAEDVTTDLNPALRITTIAFRQTRNNLPAIPVAQIVAATDTVNQGPFQGAPAGTVKFDGASSQRRLFSNGSPGWDMTYAFTYRSVGWNVAYDPANGWRPVVLKSTSQPPFPMSDYNQLFL
ncbi:MAG: hypothetical protein M3O30_17005 [Planctomycetota bacterium]|nr:hypothetical protein [Planctomycetota bacterium]